MPSSTEKQARFMRAVAHGWEPTHTKAPPVGVAQEFVAADQAVGMYEGGLAPMNDLRQRMDAPGLNLAFQEGGDVSFKQLSNQFGGGIKGYFRAMEAVNAGEYFKNEDGTYRLPHPTILQAQAPEDPVPMMAQGPSSGGRGRGGGGGGGPGGGPGGGGARTRVADESCPSGYRWHRNGQPRGCAPVPPDPGDRIIPPDVPPGGIPPGGDGGPYVPPDPREGRDTEYSDAIRAHKLRIAASLAVPPGGYAEGGEVRPGHHEDLTERNPYDKDKRPASWAQWERKYHVDPPPPPPPPVEEEQGFLARWLGLGVEEDRQGKTDEYLESQGEGRGEDEVEQAYGGYIDGYANGGLAQANFRGFPRGGMPPRMDPRAMPPQPYGGATTGQGSLPQHLQHTTGGPGKPRMDPRSMPPMQQRLPVGMMDPRQRIAPPPGKYPRFPGGGRGGRGMPPMPPGGGYGGRRMPPPRMRPPPGVDPRGGPGVPPGGGGGPVGGPRIPSNLRGQLQMRQMMNRPRRGVPGPAGAGGQPNRVGMQDQQGGLARALQRGTGRPPMSRRSGFPGR